MSKGEEKNQQPDERFDNKRDQQKRQDSDRQPNDPSQSPSRQRE